METIINFAIIPKKKAIQIQIGPACFSSSVMLKIKIDFRTKLTISSTTFRLGNLNLNLSSFTKNLVAIFNVKWPKLCSAFRRRDFIHRCNARGKSKSESDGDGGRRKVIGCNNEMK